MNRHSIVVRLSAADTKTVKVSDDRSRVSTLQFVDEGRRIRYGIGQMLEQLFEQGMYPGEAAIDLAILAATVTAADTRIVRTEDSQDSWTREIDLYIPVADPDLWRTSRSLIERILKFLTGDLWRVTFRSRQKGLETIIDPNGTLASAPLDSVCLFSGGLDSFVGAIDLLANKRRPLFVSHYRDASTKGQEACATKLQSAYGSLRSRHLRANVSFDKNDMPGTESETTTRGRSFIFIALACLAADSITGTTPIYVPENGLISLNVPLNPLRLGAWSTRTTHPFYMARWQDLVNRIGINACLQNPYRFKTKGEMLADCKNREVLEDSLATTNSCSSVTKGRWQGRSPGHCGYCTPCLIRRASIATAFQNDPTKYSVADLATHRFDALGAESTDIRAFQMMSRRLSDNPELANILVHKPGPLGDYDSKEVEAYASVFSRGIREIGNIVDDIKMRTV